MKNKLNLTADELKNVASIMELLSERAKYKISFDQLLKKWKNFVIQVENGYNDSIYEYTNDLSVRDMLNELLLKASDELREKLILLIHPTDDQFYKATSATDTPLAPNISFDMFPWWFRVPKKLGEELKNDLLSKRIM